MIKESYFCDICENEIETDDRHNMQVIFTTEQTEGKGISPYFSNVKIHMCNDCKDIALSGKYLFASGAMGYNEYWFKEDKDKNHEKRNKNKR